MLAHPPRPPFWFPHLHANHTARRSFPRGKWDIADTIKTRLGFPLSSDEQQSPPQAHGPIPPAPSTHSLSSHLLSAPWTNPESTHPTPYSLPKTSLTNFPAGSTPSPLLNVPPVITLVQGHFRFTSWSLGVIMQSITDESPD